MIIRISCAKCVGIEAVPVTVEVDVTLGIGIHLVGLADIAVKESLLRTVTALNSVGYRIPGKKIVINLAPADMHKQGSGYDLPIALGIIAASGQMELPLLDEFLMMGELSLDGSLRPVNGALSMAELAEASGKKGCIFPYDSALEATAFRDFPIYGARSLPDVLRILRGDLADDLLVTRAMLMEREGKRILRNDYMDFSQIIGQESVKRGLEIAAAGGHNVIMIGAPGAGKTSLAKAMAGILPPMSTEEAILVSKVYSAAGKNSAKFGLMRRRPFRAPHYSASMAAMIGGGNGENIVPGEVSLASGGVLFIDEFAQMPKNVMEALRGPIEDRKVVISRLHSKIEYPASFMFVAASNPCPCGYFGEKDRCSCTPTQRLSYLGRLSGPLMDRIDIQLWVHTLEAEKLIAGHRGHQKGAESSAEITARVLRVREKQAERFGRQKTNAEMDASELHRFCPLSPECENVLEMVIEKMGLSARAFSRIIKLSRTIADLENSENIETAHILEAASFRFLDRRDPLAIQ